jgi:hypothetical protein
MCFMCILGKDARLKPFPRRSILQLAAGFCMVMQLEMAYWDSSEIGPESVEMEFLQRARDACLNPSPVSMKSLFN